VVKIKDIEPGMTVYSDDGQQIGTVKEIFPKGRIPPPLRRNEETGGGFGTLGDESRVYTDTGTGGGPETLGDEERVYADPGTEGGAGALGDEQRVVAGTSDAEAAGEVLIREEIAITEPATDIGDEPVFEVDHGGILGFGTRRLFIPLSAVASIEATRLVVLTCTAQECMDQYAAAG